MATPRPLLQVIEEVYQDIDAQVIPHVTKMGTTCTRGCDHCCYLFVSCTAMEAVGLAEILLGQDDEEATMKRLVAAAEATLVKDLSVGDWFEKQIPCVFLDTEKHECTIYEWRPEACRLHYVISPPRLCSLEAGNGARTAQIDLDLAREVIWKMNSHFVHEASCGFVVGPLALGILWAMDFVLSQGQTAEAKNWRLRLRELTKHLPTPETWMRDYTKNLMCSHRGQPLTPEEEQALRTAQ